jgi:hypothetical protein
MTLNSVAAVTVFIFQAPTGQQGDYTRLLLQSILTRIYRFFMQ